MNTKKLGNVIAQRRTELGLTQQEVATRIRTQQHSISALENGLRDPKYSTLTAIAAALRIAPSELLRRTESQKRKKN